MVNPTKTKMQELLEDYPEIKAEVISDLKSAQEAYDTANEIRVEAILRAFNFYQLTWQEIADAMGLTKNYVYSFITNSIVIVEED